MLTFGSLFSGIGGIDLGLERAGWECRWQVEIDDFNRTILRKHWPGVTQHGDITKLTGDELPYVDLLAGGFPCQDLSYAGKQAGIEGSRSGLWLEYARLIGELRPRYVLIENVPGLLVHGAMRRVVGDLARLGYVGIWRCFLASEFGASHLRKRVFLLAMRGDTDGRHDLADTAGRARSRWSTPNDGSDLRRHVSGQRDAGSSGEIPLAHSPQRGRGELRESTDPSGEWLGTFAPGPSDPRWPAILRARPDLAPALAHTANNGRRFGPNTGANGRGLVSAGESGQDADLRTQSVRSGGSVGPEGREAPSQSPLCRVADGLPSGLYGDPMTNRTKRLSRLGNAVVPQIAEYIGLRLREFAEYDT